MLKFFERGHAEIVNVTSASIEKGYSVSVWIKHIGAIKLADRNAVIQYANMYFMHKKRTRFLCEAICNILKHIERYGMRCPD